MLIGIDDTDSPQGMCTKDLGAVLARRLIHAHNRVHEARLIRLNPNVTFKTRGNAAIALDVTGDMDRAFAISCAVVEELADFSCENTNPGVVVVDQVKEACARLLEMYPDARVIACSGYSSHPVMSDHAAYGFLGMLGKPYQIEDLRRVVDEVMSPPKGKAAGNRPGR